MLVGRRDELAADNMLFSWLLIRGDERHKYFSAAPATLWPLKWPGLSREYIPVARQRHDWIVLFGHSVDVTS